MLISLLRVKECRLTLTPASFSLDDAKPFIAAQIDRARHGTARAEMKNRQKAL